MKKYTFFGKTSDLGISRTKDFIVMGVCLFLYVVFIGFIFTPAGSEFFEWIRKYMPFMNLIDSALTDMDKLLGLMFEKIGLNKELNTFSQMYGEITFPGLFLDLTKLMVSSCIQSLLFTGFSFLFLHAGNFDIVSKLIGGEKEDFLYCINSFLLRGISLFIGVLTGNWLIGLISKPIMELDPELSFWVSVIIFIVAYILFSIYFMLRAKKSAGGGFSLRRALIKTSLFNILPEILTLFVTNIVAVFTFSCFVTYKVHFVSVLALFILLFWAWLANIITDALKKLFVINPFCGKNCPISGLLWLPATVSLVMMFYMMALPNAGRGSNPLEASVGAVPFLGEWGMGVPLFDTVAENLAYYKVPLLQLFFICNAAALFQYITSSYTFTLFTQIIVRFFLMGFALVYVSLTYMIIYLCEPLAQSIQYVGIAIFIAAILYIFYAICQPYLALQGILTTALVLAVMQWLPGISLSTGAQATSQAGLGLYLGGSLVSIGLNLLLSLLQNIATFFEKKFWLAKKLIK